jgi:hypothetical protein
LSRIHTPPGLKWALNQRAAVAGRIELLTQRVRAVQTELDAAIADLAALDRAIAVLDARVRSDALGPIRAWAGRYGERGALNRFIEKKLRDAGQVGITTTELSLAVQVEFGLDFATSGEREAFQQQSLKNRLLEWQKRGVLEVTYEAVSNGRVARWRMKQPVTLAELAERASRT